MMYNISRLFPFSTPALLTYAAVAMLIVANPAFSQKDAGTQENLGSAINSPAAELVPVVSPDGKTLYFDRKHSPDNTGGTNDPDDIYYSELQPNGEWGPAINIGPPLNTTGSDVLFWISPDGNSALVYHGKQVDGKDVGLSISQRVNGKWSEPKKINIQGLDHLGDYYYAHMSPDGKRLFIAYVDDPSTAPHDFNIFYSAALSDDLMQWERPVKLGPPINNFTSEGAPFIASDNQTLYFISNKPGGIGQSDIYVSRRIGESWLQWSTPVNLGPGINSPSYEAGFSIPASGDWLYTSRTTKEEDGGFGRTDLFRLRLPDSMRPKSSFLLSGELINKTTGAGISGLIMITDEKGKNVATTTSRNDGSFGVVLTPGSTYTLEGSASGYAPNSTKLNVQKYNPNRSYSVTIELESTGTNETPLILFASGSASLSRENRIRLQQLSKSLIAGVNSGSISQITVVGHTDSLGTEEDNLRLSQRRAETVKKQLVAWGIPANRIVTSGQGENQPIGTNGTSRGRAVNRRVELTAATSIRTIETPAPRRE